MPRLVHSNSIAAVIRAIFYGPDILLPTATDFLAPPAPVERGIFERLGG
jgi:hypothetical protein